MVSYSSAIPDYTLRMYFESVVDKEYVSDVQLVSSSRALVTFTNHQCKSLFNNTCVSDCHVRAVAKRLNNFYSPLPCGC